MPFRQLHKGYIGKSRKSCNYAALNSGLIFSPDWDVYGKDGICNKPTKFQPIF